MLTNVGLLRFFVRLSALLFALCLTHPQSLMASLLVDRQEDKHVANYILDSSMASLIMDGELWGRCPSSLVGHKMDLQAALFGSEYRKLSELPQTTSYVPRATNAYSWAKGVVEQSNTDVLYITPTVRNELMRAPQVSHAVLMHCIFLSVYM